MVFTGGEGLREKVHGGDGEMIELGLFVCIWLLSHSASVFHRGRYLYYSWMTGMSPDSGQVIILISYLADDGHSRWLSIASKGPVSVRPP